MTLFILPQPPPFPRLRLRLVRRRRRRLPPLPPSRLLDRPVRSRAFLFLPRFRRVERSQRRRVDPLVVPSRVVVPAVPDQVLALAVVSRPRADDRRVHRVVALQTNRLRAEFKSRNRFRRRARRSRRSRARGDVRDRTRRREHRGLGRGEHRAAKTTRRDAMWRFEIFEISTLERAPRDARGVARDDGRARGRADGRRATRDARTRGASDARRESSESFMTVG